jgi:pilus assembly protein Flp/PilA
VNLALVASVRPSTFPALHPTSAPFNAARGAPDVHSKMFKSIKTLLRDDSGATAVEYGLIVAAIAGLIIVVVFLLGKKVNNAFSNVASHMP